MELQKGVSVHRLLCDLKEVLTNPIPNVAALPLEDDLYVWHGNVRSEEGSLAGAPIHFILKFPESYPNDPPEIRLLQAVPHPNVKPVPGIQVLNAQPQQAAGGRRSHPFPRRARWRLAMWDCIPEKNSYSSSYTVLSVLLQLQVFLLDEDLQYDTQTISPEAARRTALELHCPQCPHASPTIHPAFPTPADLEAALKARNKLRMERPFVPARSRGTAAALQAHQKIRPPAAPSPAAAAPAAGGGCGAAVAAASSSSAGSTLKAPGGPKQQQQQPVKEEEWVCVTGKKGSSKKGPAAAAAFAAAGASSPSMPSSSSSSAQVISQGRFGTLRTSAAHKVVKGALLPNTSAAKQQAGAPAGGSTPAAAAAGGGGDGAAAGAVDPSKLSKSSLKRYKKKLSQQQEGVGACSTTSSISTGSGKVAGPITPPATPSARPASAGSSSSLSSFQSSHHQQQQEEEEEGGWKVAGKGGKASGAQGAEGAGAQKNKKNGDPVLEMLKGLVAADHTQIIQQTLAAASSSSNGVQATSGSTTSYSSSAAWAVESLQQLSLPCGLFSSLPRDALLAILTLLKPKDLAALSQSCQGLHAWCNDGALWQELLGCHFPRHQVTASQMCDWKTAYVMESNSLLEGLRCWHTRVGYEEDVLGLPITYTKNPRTGAVDYILAHPDLISMTAFKAGVRQTPERETFEAVLPLYLTADHFNRALPHLAPLLKQLAPEQVGRGGGLPPPEAWLDVLAKVLNTQAVLLADNGLVASQRALQVYCQVHRLLLAVSEHWGLWGVVAARLDRFLSSEKEREKGATPNLGLLVPLLSLSPSHKWRQVVQPLVAESLARGVLWMCKKDIGLVQLLQSPLAPTAEPKLLGRCWSASRVSTRLMMYQVIFLHLVACPPGSSLERVMDSYDGLFGCPGAALGGRFQKVVKEILEVNSWQEYFQRIGLVYQDDVTMTNLLKSAWRRSLAKKYHTRDTDFSKIQASGVSRILLKGQAYSCPPNTKDIELEVHYKWRPEFYVRYLDGACLLFGPDREYKEMVCWCHQESYTTAHPAAVTHSGDIMEFENQAGKNTASLQLGRVGPGVQEVVVTLSAWADAMLSDIIQPYVQLYEPKSGMELCQCHLDSTSIVTRMENKCIIMARIYRKTDGSGWGVQSVMEMCQGNTSNTEPMIEAVQQVLARG